MKRPPSNSPGEALGKGTNGVLDICDAIMQVQWYL